MHEVLVNRLGGLSLPRKSVVRVTDRPDMTLDVYRERKTTIQQQQQQQYFMYYVFSRIYYVSRRSHGRMAILAKCVTLLKYCVNK